MVFNCEFVTFPLVYLGQVWYLIVSIPDLCTLTYFGNQFVVFLRVVVIYRFYCNYSSNLSVGETNAIEDRIGAFL